MGFWAVLAVLLTALSTPLVGIYNLSPEASSIAVALIVVHSFAMIIWPVAFALPNALRAASDVKFTMVTAVFSMWAFRIGLSYVLVLGFHLGVMGVWIAMFADWGFRAVLFFIRYRSGGGSRSALKNRLLGNSGFPHMLEPLPLLKTKIAAPRDKSVRGLLV